MERNSLMINIIPPQTREGRENFDGNTSIIDSLNKDDKLYVEDELIKMAQISDDILILDTLVYLKSKKSIPILSDILKKESNPKNKIFLSSSIFRIDNSFTEMKSIAIDSLEQINDKAQLGVMFYYLVKFNDKKVNELIRSYYGSQDFLVSYHAKNSLGEVKENKKRWKFWN